MRRRIPSYPAGATLLAVCTFSLCGCATITGPSGVLAPTRPSLGGVPALPGAMRTIVVDAGHGGKDPGTSHFGLQEKHLNLDIARRLRAELQQVGLQVVMTRDSDQFISLSGRPRVANQLNAGLFVSLHINANKNRRVSGAEVYYPRETTPPSMSQWPPAVQASEVGVPSVAVKHVLWDLVLGRRRADSRRLATSVCGALREGLQVHCKVKSARFVVLRETRMPAILVEVGYVSNPVESQRLNQPSYRAAAAGAVTKGVLSYLRAMANQSI